jgi:hypothetical protein
MNIGQTRFNIYFLCLTLLWLASGCLSPESQQDKQLAELRIYVEANPDTLAGMTERVPIYRASPTQVRIDRTPILKQSDVAEAKMIEDTMGGFALQIQFNPHGTLVLEQYTALSPGKHFPIYAAFGDKLSEHRWLAAPIISRRIPDGILSFTPDATREEVQQIARGLNNVAIKEGNQTKSKAKSKAK